MKPTNLQNLDKNVFQNEQTLLDIRYMKHLQDVGISPGKAAAFLYVIKKNFGCVHLNILIQINPKMGMQKYVSLARWKSKINTRNQKIFRLRFEYFPD